MPIGASRQVGHFFNAIRHHDGCRLVHLAKWDIGQFRGAFVTDADWCIPSGGSFDYQLSHFDSIFTFVFSFQGYTQSMYSFHIHIHILISYTHSHAHFIYTFMHSFHMLGKLPKILDIRIESENKHEKT